MEEQIGFLCSACDFPIANFLTSCPMCGTPVSIDDVKLSGWSRSQKLAVVTVGFVGLYLLVKK